MLLATVVLKEGGFFVEVDVDADGGKPWYCAASVAQYRWRSTCMGHGCQKSNFVP